MEETQPPPRLPPPAMPFFLCCNPKPCNFCCCGCPLRTGVYILSVIGMIQGCLNILSFNLYGATVGVIHLLFSLYGFQSAQQLDPHRARVFYLYQLALSCIGIFMTTLFALAGYFITRESFKEALSEIAKHAGEHTGDKNYPTADQLAWLIKHQTPIVIGVYVGITIAGIVEQIISVYFAFVSWSFKTHLDLGARTLVAYGSTERQDELGEAFRQHEIEAAVYPMTAVQPAQAREGTRAPNTLNRY
eukprot:Filipodium_phascolosomae@DN4570_c0_g1_i1.p1